MAACKLVNADRHSSTCALLRNVREQINVTICDDDNTAVVGALSCVHAGRILGGRLKPTGTILAGNVMRHNEHPAGALRGVHAMSPRKRRGHHALDKGPQMAT